MGTTKFKSELEVYMAHAYALYTNTEQRQVDFQVILRPNWFARLWKIYSSNIDYWEHGLMSNLSNVSICWLAMPLVVGFLRWVLVCRTIERDKFAPPPLHTCPSNWPIEAPASA